MPNKITEKKNQIKIDIKSKQLWLAEAVKHNGACKSKGNRRKVQRKTKSRMIESMSTETEEYEILQK